MKLSSTLYDISLQLRYLSKYGDRPQDEDKRLSSSPPLPDGTWNKPSLFPVCGFFLFAQEKASVVSSRPVPPPSVEAKNIWRCNSTLSYCFVTRCIIKEKIYSWPHGVYLQLVTWCISTAARLVYIYS